MSIKIRKRKYCENCSEFRFVLDNIAIAVFVVILVEFDISKCHSVDETNRIV